MNLDPQSPEFETALEEYQRLLAVIRAKMAAGEDYDADLEQLHQLQQRTGIAEEIGPEALDE